MSDPVVNHFETTVFLNSVINAADMFSVSDADGDAIVTLRIEDYQSRESTGFWRLNGVAQTNGAPLTISFAQLGELEYVAGSTIAFEGFRVIAFNNVGERSELANFGRVYTVRDNTTAPVMFNDSLSVVADESASLESIVRGFDSDGFPITQYFLRDSKADAGFLELNGVALQQRQFTLVQAEDMANLRYVANGGDSVEEIFAFAYDGAKWSARGVIPITTVVNANRPVAQFARLDVISRDVVPLDSSINVVDDDGNTIKWYEILNTSPHLSHGNVLVNGVAIPRKTWIRVTPEELADVEYAAPNRDLVQQIRIRGNDGKFTSDPSTISVRTTFEEEPPPIVRPNLATDEFIYDDQLEVYQVDDLFRKDDAGNPYTLYELVDIDPDLESGRFRINTNHLPGGVVHQFTEFDIDQRVDFQTGEYNNRHRDDIYGRAFNGDEWSKWERITVRSEPELSRTHMSGNNWNLYPEIPVDGLGRYELSFSFMQLFPDYETGEAIDGEIEDNEQFERFTEGQRIATREAFLAIEAVTNLKFVEVPDTSTNVFGGRGGIFRFGEYGIEFDTSVAQAFAFFPSRAPQAADIWINRQIITDVSLRYGGPGFNTNMHEIMHALGFNHIFEGTSIVPASVNSDRYSVLSGPGGGRPDGLQNTTPQIYDIESLQTIYGENTRANAGDTLYDLTGYFANRPDFNGDGVPEFAEAIWDPSGNDTLSGEDSVVGVTIDLTPGGFSSINGFNDNVAIAYRAEIENATGSIHSDSLFGNHLFNTLRGGDGDDLLEGQGGNDLLFGGVGDDTYVFGIGDGNDTIDEERQAGVDTLRLGNFPNLDRLEEDLRFRMEGRDLLVDLNLDNGANEATVRIVNQVWGRSQIETLDLNGTQIDLKALSAQVTASDDTFALGGGSTGFGLLVVPV